MNKGYRFLLILSFLFNPLNLLLASVVNQQSSPSPVKCPSLTEKDLKAMCEGTALGNEITSKNLRIKALEGCQNKKSHWYSRSKPFEGFLTQNLEYKAGEGASYTCEYAISSKEPKLIVQITDLTLSPPNRPLAQAPIQSPLQPSAQAPLQSSWQAANPPNRLPPPIPLQLSAQAPLQSSWQAANPPNRLPPPIPLQPSAQAPLQPSWQATNPPNRLLPPPIPLQPSAQAPLQSSWQAANPPNRLLPPIPLQPSAQAPLHSPWKAANPSNRSIAQAPLEPSSSAENTSARPRSSAMSKPTPINESLPVSPASSPLSSFQSEDLKCPSISREDLYYACKQEERAIEGDRNFILIKKQCDMPLIGKWFDAVVRQKGDKLYQGRRLETSLETNNLQCAYDIHYGGFARREAEVIFSVKINYLEDQRQKILTTLLAEDSNAIPYPNDPASRYVSEEIKLMGIEKMWELGYTGAGQKVMVWDINSRKITSLHPSLEKNFLAGYDMPAYHGCHVAGIIASSPFNKNEAKSFMYVPEEEKILNFRQYKVPGTAFNAKILFRGFASPSAVKFVRETMQDSISTMSGSEEEIQNATNSLKFTFSKYSENVVYLDNETYQFTSEVDLNGFPIEIGYEGIDERGDYRGIRIRKGDILKLDYLKNEGYLFRNNQRINIKMPMFVWTSETREFLSNLIKRLPKANHEAYLIKWHDMLYCEGSFYYYMPEVKFMNSTVNPIADSVQARIITEAESSGIKVINFSAHSPFGARALQAMKSYYKNGGVFVAALGNGGISIAGLEMDRMSEEFERLYRNKAYEMLFNLYSKTNSYVLTGKNGNEIKEARSRVVNKWVGIHTVATLFKLMRESPDFRKMFIFAVNLSERMKDVNSTSTTPGNTVVAERTISAWGTTVPSTVTQINEETGEEEHIIRELTGTSMATPFVSGALALLLEAYPQCPAGALATALLESAQPMKAPLSETESFFTRWKKSPSSETESERKDKEALLDLGVSPDIIDLGVNPDIFDQPASKRPSPIFGKGRMNVRAAFDLAPIYCHTDPSPPLAATGK